MSRALLLPPAAPGWPSALTLSDAATAQNRGAATTEIVAALARIRAERLFWPAPRLGAPKPRILALDAIGEAQARAAHDAATILRVRDPAEADPERFERIYGGSGSIALWSLIGGVSPEDGRDEDDRRAAALLARSVGRSPWTAAPISLSDAVEAQAFLRAAALERRGRVALVGMSRWKRRCLRPFLTGPDGPPRRAATLAAAGDARPALWGGDVDAPPGALRVEDGFVRSVGLGLRHTPPISLAIAEGAPYFDATRRNAFEETVADAVFDAALLARARALRSRLLALRLTKYNLPDAGRLPSPGNRMALLAPGQVAADASIRLGSGAARTDLALLEAAHARFPDAFLIYKPHPDVLTGLRGGGAPAAAVARLADHVETRASAAQCLDWADRVVTITSLTGFEALLRGIAVTTLGKPFYAGWGLTDDVEPPPRDRQLTLDELVAAALILHVRYIDPRTRLPAPPEVALEALAQARARAGQPGARAVRLWRNAVSWGLNRLP